MQNLINVIIFLVLSSVNVNGNQYKSLIINTQARESITLDGKWDIIVDPYETGYYNHRYQPSESGYFKDARMENPSDLVEYSFESGPKIYVPGDWNTQDDKLFFYEGTVWYRRVFDVTVESDKRSFLYFGAVNYESVIYLNGEKIGEHTGGFTPFNIEVTGKLKKGKNFVILKVDNTRKREAVPTVNTDWWNYGGITRSVKLIKTPKTFVRDYFVQLEKGNLKNIKGWVQLDGTQKEQQVTVSIPELSIEKELHTDASGRAGFEIPAKKISYWNPENPKLYNVIIHTETDKVEEKIGFRSIEVKGGDILLNGESVFLRGICLHEEVPYNDGRANNESHARTLLSWAKEMNCNFVRLAHYPHNEHMTRMADEMGLMVWSEIPVYWTILWDDPAVYENAANQLGEMITRDKNKASIIMWSVANETPVIDERVTFLGNLAALARELDPTRLITAALDTQSSDEEGKVIDDPLAAIVDVIGINSYCGWYGPDLPGACDNLKWKNPYNKPMIMSEFGGGALQGYHGTELDRWTEEYQASVYEHNLEMIKNISFLRGTTPWILKDFRSARRPLPEIQDYWNRKGLISDRGIKKKAFWIMKKFYDEIEQNWK
ncbi:MAG: glycoside hydrolase family 2 protein [Bacteroidota bacterium]